MGSPHMAELLARLGLERLDRALIYGLGLVVVLGLIAGAFHIDLAWLAFLVRWLHVVSGIMWVGLLWYFNFVQIPAMGRLPEDLRPAVSQFITLAALFWFRHAALATLASGLLLAHLNGYIGQALTLGIWSGGGKPTAIGIGMWLGIVLAYNVWMVIWPNQKKALGLVEAGVTERKAAARLAMLVGRLNTALSLPMLYFMVAAQNLY